MASFAAETVAAITDDLDALGHMPSLQAQHLLTTKSVAHRVNHLQRNIPGGEVDIFGDLALRYYRSILLVAQRAAGQESFSPVTSLLCALPQIHGGLCYRTWANTCDAAFLASYAYVSRSFRDWFPY